MKIKRAQFDRFKRFHNLTLDEIPEATRLVVLVGPNGAGKSSVFDGFRLWHSLHDSRGFQHDVHYHRKVGVDTDGLAPTQQVTVDFHQAMPTEEAAKKKLFYFRSSYRNEADFVVTQLQRSGPVLNAPVVSRMIDNDSTVSGNYQRLVADAVDHLFTDPDDGQTVRQIRDRLLGKIRESMRRVFNGLELSGTGDPLDGGTFLFGKGNSKDFQYKNLSGGEKAAFDLLLDVVVKAGHYDDTVFCVDEPETHMHTRLQGQLLAELFRAVPERSQLWIATHSIGMMRKATELVSTHPGQVVFLDFGEANFDSPATLTPVAVDRRFWVRLLEVALDDLAGLVAPRRVVLCEGKPKDDKNPGRSGFDSKCYRTIFGSEFSDTDFISVGSEMDVRTDPAGVSSAIQTIAPATTFCRVVDRDGRSAQEVQDLKAADVRVLRRRHLESYLLDDSVLEALCRHEGKLDDLPAVLKAKADAVTRSVTRGNPVDDLKSAAGEITVAIRKILAMTTGGNTTETFLRDTLAPLVREAETVYAELRDDLFGS